MQKTYPWVLIRWVHFKRPNKIGNLKRLTELKQTGCEVVLGHGVMFGQWFGGPFSAIGDHGYVIGFLRGGGDSPNLA